MTSEVKPGERALLWWKESRMDLAAMAQLRRVQDPIDAWAVPAFWRLHDRLGPSQEFASRHAWLAATLAHVQRHTEQDLPTRLGTPGRDPSSPVWSEMRARRLFDIERDDPRSLSLSLRRAVHILDGTANVRDIADAILFWGDRMVRDWSYRYFNVAIKKRKV